MHENLYESGIRPYLESYFRNSQEPYPNYWRGSSAGYCYRYNIFKRIHLPEVPEIDDSFVTTQNTFYIGTSIHIGYQKITAQIPENIGQENEIKLPEFDVIGHYDDLFEFDYGDDKPMSHKILYDYKTVSSKSFNYTDPEMRSTHRLQLGTYMYALRKEHPDLAEGRIMEISKDDGRMRERQLLWDDTLESDIQAYWNGLNKAWKAFKKTGDLPDCTCAERLGDWFATRTKAGKIYNGYFLNGNPCSLEWYLLNTKEVA